MNLALNCVLIIDDHRLFLEGLNVLFKYKYQCPKVLTADNTSLALNIVQNSNDIELVLLDLDMPDLDGLDFINLLAELKIQTPIIIVSSTDNTRQIKQALEQGVMGFIPKSYAGNRMGEAIQKVLEGNLYIPESMQYKLAHFSEQKNNVKLSTRQIEVIKLVDLGLSNKEIADQLFISESTVKSHLSNIFSQFDTQNRVVCVRKAKEFGFID